MKKVTKIAAEGTSVEDPMVETPPEQPIAETAAPAATSAPAAPAATAVPQQQDTVPDEDFANFQAMLNAVQEIQSGLVGKERYKVSTESGKEGKQFTLKITAQPEKVVPASLTRPTRSASKILAESFPADWLKSMGL